MARWRPSKGWESERALPKRSRRWGELVFYKSPKWGYIVKKVPDVPPSSKQAIAFWIEWLKWVNVLYKYTAPEVLAELKRQEQLFKVPARDVFTSAMNGLLFVISTDDGREIYSMAHVERISKSLDVFSRTRGALLVRHDEVWQGLNPGLPGEVLTIGEDGFPRWAAVTGGGSGGGGPWVSLGFYTPRASSASDFGLRVGFENYILRAHSSGWGLFFVRPDASGGIGGSLALREISQRSRFEFGFTTLTRRNVSSGVGCALYHSSGRFIFVGPERSYFSIFRMDSYRSYHSTAYSDNWLYRDFLIALRVSESGYAVEAFGDEGYWYTLFSESWWFFGEPASHVGIVVSSDGTPALMWLWHFKEE